MDELFWWGRFLLGAFLAYLIMSPRLRRFTIGLIVWVFGSPNKRPKSTELDSPPESDNHTLVQVEPDELNEWLDKNPDLKEVNK